MLTDGESFVYRSDRPSRSRTREPLPPREPRPFPVDISERLAHLTATSDRLDRSLSRMEGLLQTLTDQVHTAQLLQVQAAPAPEPIQVPEAEADPVEVLHMEVVPAPATLPPAPQPEMKVTMYAGEGATAVLGQFQIRTE